MDPLISSLRVFLLANKRKLKNPTTRIANKAAPQEIPVFAAKLKAGEATTLDDEEGKEVVDTPVVNDPLEIPTAEEAPEAALGNDTDDIKSIALGTLDR